MLQRTSVAHMDSLDVVDIGFTQMLLLAVKHDVDDIFNVHLIGAFNDSSPQSTNHGIKSRKHRNLDGYSFPLCQKIIQTLEKSSIHFHVQLLHVLDHNTRWDSQGNAYPIFHGFLVYSIRDVAANNLKRLAEEFGPEWAKQHIVPQYSGITNGKGYPFPLAKVLGWDPPYFCYLQNLQRGRGLY